MKLGNLLTTKINRLAAGGDGSFGRAIGMATTVGGEHVYRGSDKVDKFGHAFFRVGWSKVGEQDVVIK